MILHIPHFVSIYYVAINIIWIFIKQTDLVTKIEIIKAKKAFLALIISQIVGQKEQKNKILTEIIIN